MPLRIICAAVCIYTAILCLSCSSNSGPSKAEQEESFTEGLPAFLSVQSFEIKTSMKAKEDGDPLYRGRFHAQLQVNSGTYKILDRDVDTVIVRKMATQGDKLKVVGTTESKLDGGNWQISVKLIGSPIDSLGVPMDTLSSTASRIMMEGSDEAQSYRSEKAKRLVADKKTRRAAEPDYITVQHILIAFQGTIKNKRVTRTIEEARVLAKGILQRAKEGESFDSLVEAYTDDTYPGIYKMANTGVPSRMSENIFARERMVRAFGDISFSLKMDEIGMAEYNPIKSPYGWHIIKRVEPTDDHTGHQH
jgi:hypothetical protein